MGTLEGYAHREASDFRWHDGPYRGDEDPEPEPSPYQQAVARIRREIEHHTATPATRYGGGEFEKMAVLRGLNTALHAALSDAAEDE